MLIDSIPTPLKGGETLRTDTKLILSADVWDFLEEAIDHVKAEVGGVGYVYETQSGDLYVDEVWITPQEVSPTRVTFLPDADVLAIEKSVEDDRINDLRFSWHSHDTMPVYWSSIDEDGVKTRLEREMPYLVSYVGNKKGEARARIDAPIYDVPWMRQATKDPIKIVRERRYNPAMREAALTQIKEHVQVKTWTYSQTSGKGKGSKKAAKKAKQGDEQKLFRPTKIPLNIWNEMSEADKRFAVYGPEPEESSGPNITIGTGIDLSELSPDEFQLWLDSADDDDALAALGRYGLGEDPGISVESLVVNGPNEEIAADNLPYGIQPHEVIMLRDAGHDLDNMTDEAIMTALLEEQIAERGQD